jgi:membrane protein
VPALYFIENNTSRSTVHDDAGITIEKFILIMKSISIWHFGGLTPLELIRRIWKEVNQDFIFDSAAALSYYWILSVFPLLIFLVSMFSLIPSGAEAKSPLLNSLLAMGGRVMPGKAFFLIAVAAERLSLHARGGLLTLGFLATLWSASTGVSSLMAALNRAYEIPERRSFLKRSILSIVLTVALTVLAVVGAALLMASDLIGTWFQHHAAGVAWIGSILSVICGLAALLAGFGIMYYYGPSLAKQHRQFFTPGLVIAILLFLIASAGLSIYLRLSSGFSSPVYGVFGALIILLLWLYVLGLAILLGGEINSEIWKASNA